MNKYFMKLVTAALTALVASGSFALAQGITGPSTASPGEQFEITIDTRNVAPDIFFQSGCRPDLSNCSWAVYQTNSLVQERDRGNTSYFYDDAEPYYISGNGNSYYGLSLNNQTGSLVDREQFRLVNPLFPNGSGVVTLKRQWSANLPLNQPFNAAPAGYNGSNPFPHRWVDVYALYLFRPAMQDRFGNQVPDEYIPVGNNFAQVEMVPNSNITVGITNATVGDLFNNNTPDALTFTVTNNGPMSSQNDITVNFAVPAGLAITSAPNAPSGFSSCTLTSCRLLAGLPAGASRTFTAPVRVTSVGTYNGAVTRRISTLGGTSNGSYGAAYNSVINTKTTLIPSNFNAD